MTKNTGFTIGDGYGLLEKPFNLDLGLLVLLRDKLHGIVVRSEVYKKDPEWLYTMQCNFYPDNRERPEILGPDRSKRRKYATWVMWMPTEKIIDSDNPLQSFTDYFFDALVPFMAKEFGADEAELWAFKKEVEQRLPEFSSIPPWWPGPG